MDPTAVLAAVAGEVNTAALMGNTAQVVATPFMPAEPEVPHFYPFFWRGTYERSYDGMVELTMTWHLLLSRAEEENAAAEASALSGTGSNTIYAAVMGGRKQGTRNKYRGDVADDIVVRSVEGPRQFTFGTDGPYFWGLEFTIFAMG